MTENTFDIEKGADKNLAYASEDVKVADNARAALGTEFLASLTTKASQAASDVVRTGPIPLPPPFPRPEPDPWPRDPCAPDGLPWPKPGCELPKPPEHPKKKHK